MNESAVLDIETPVHSNVVSTTSVEAPQDSAAEVPESIEENGGMKRFPIEMFPPELAAYAKALSKDTGFDVAGIAATMLSISAGLIGKSRKWYVKPGWIEPTSLWSAVIASSGSRKSVVLKALMRWSNEKDIELRLQREAVERAEAERIRQAARKKDRGDDKDTSVVENIAKSEMTSMSKPVLVTQDATWEKELRLIKESPNGILKSHHEMKNWFEEMTKHNSDTSAYYCQLYDGDTVRQDRCEHGTMVVPDALISIASMVQPAVLGKEATPLRWAQGLMPRFLLVYVQKKRKIYSESEDEVYGTKTWENVQYHLFNLRDEKPLQIPVCREPEVNGISAHQLLVPELNLRGERQYGFEEGSPEEAITGKADGWCVRIAGILSLWCQILNPKYRGRNIITDEPIRHAHIRSAIALTRWFEEEAIRSSSKILEASNKQNQGTLAEWVASKPDGVVARDLMLWNRKQYPNAEKAEIALIGLFKAGRAERKPYKPPTGREIIKYYPK